MAEQTVDRTRERTCPVCYMGDLDFGPKPDVMQVWEEDHDSHCWGRWPEQEPIHTRQEES